MTPAFKVGDRVTWGGDSSPHINEKSGVVIQVVPACQAVLWERLPEAERHGHLLAEGMARRDVSYVVRVGSKLYWPRVKVLRAVVEEPTEIPPYAGRKHDGQFTSFENWCDKAKSWIGGLDAACFDAKGRPCRAGLDFMRARDEGAFPVRYWFPRESAHWQQTRDLEDAAARTS